MTCGLVVLNYKDDKTTSEFIEANAAIRGIDHVVVVDNCSEDGSYEKLMKYQNHRIKVIQSHKNGGYSYGNNLGCKYLIDNYQDEIIIIANPDIILNYEYIVQLKDKFEKYQDYAVLTGVMCNRDGSKDPYPYLFLPTFMDELLECFFVGRYYLKNRNKKRTAIEDSREVINIEGAPGCLFAIRSNVLKAINYFDDGVFLFYEEIILGYKIGQAGYKLGLIPAASYIHDHSVTIRKLINDINKCKIYVTSKLYYQKNYRKINRVKYLILFMFTRAYIVESYLLFPCKYLLNKLGIKH